MFPYLVSNLHPRVSEAGSRACSRPGCQKGRCKVDLTLRSVVRFKVEQTGQIMQVLIGSSACGKHVIFIGSVACFGEIKQDKLPRDCAARTAGRRKMMIWTVNRSRLATDFRQKFHDAVVVTESTDGSLLCRLASRFEATS